MIYRVIGLYILCTISIINADTLIDQARKSLLPSVDYKLFTSRYEQEKERLAVLKHAKQEMYEMEKSLLPALNARLEQLKKQIIEYEHILDQDPDRHGIKKRLEETLELVQLLNDKKQVFEQRKALLEEQIKVHQEYLADPELQRFYTSLNADKAEFSFDEDLLKKYEMIMEHEKLLAAFAEQELHTLAELENRKRAIAAINEPYNGKKGKTSTPEQVDEIGLNARDRLVINQLREQILTERKVVNEWRVQEIEQKLDIIKLKEFMVHQQLDMLNDNFSRIKQLTRVTHADVALALDELDKKRQQTFAIKDQLRQEIERINTTLKSKDRELDMLSKRYNIAIDTELEEWSKIPRTRAAAYVSLAQVGALYTESLVIKRQKELLEAQSALEDEKLRAEELRISVKESFYRMAGRKFATEEEITKEIKKYDRARAEVKANLSLYKERQNTIAALLSSQKRALDTIKEKIHAAAHVRSTIFAGQESEFNNYVTILKQAETKISDHIDLLTKLGSLYNDIATLIVNTSKYIDFINYELSSITIWYRPEHAISVQGLKQSVPDLHNFFKDVRSYLTTISVGGVLPYLKTLFTSWFDVVFFIFKIVLLVGILWLIKQYLPSITNKLISLENAPSGVRWVSIVTAIILGFGLRHVVSLIIWVLLYFLFFFHPMPDHYPLILFYVCSIPYLLYIASRLMRYVVHFNSKYEYLLLSKEYQRRFMVVFSFLVYATIVIFFLREAFILGNYRKSELPTILLAFNFIIFQISAILLLSKDQILSLIPLRNNFWLWIRDLVDSYYYLIQVILIAIIVMSNPYVGYGRLVLYILKRVFFTAVLLQLLFWFHEWLKRATSRLFFYSDNDDDIVRDRFSYAKTWYGILVVGILLAFTFLGGIIAARVWGWPELLLKINTFGDVIAWVKTPFLLESSQSPISLFTILRILGFIIAGICVGFIINRFVLGRIFDILLIESGVQNTISSLIRYVVIIAAIVVGFQSVGLGELIWYLVAVTLGIGWVIKEPMADLISYFIIILQQPIKVGDYIWVDENTTGVVRRITPRSVEIRRKNSSTLVIPNAQITTRVISNWNYVRGYIAFDDITLTIAYKHDPAKIRELLLRVLDESRAILKNPRPIVRLESFNDLGYVFLVRGFLSTNHTLDMWDIASDLRLMIVKRLREHGIEIASAVRLMVSRSEIEQQVKGE